MKLPLGRMAQSRTECYSRSLSEIAVIAMMRTIYIVGIILLETSCSRSTDSAESSGEAWQQLHLGMSGAEVRQVLGEPDAVERDPYTGDIQMVLQRMRAAGGMLEIREPRPDPKDPSWHPRYAYHVMVYTRDGGCGIVVLRAHAAYSARWTELRETNPKGAIDEGNVAWWISPR